MQEGLTQSPPPPCSVPTACLAALCSSLQRCSTLQSLSLRYCRLGAACGEHLGALAAVSNIRYTGLLVPVQRCGALQVMQRV